MLDSVTFDGADVWVITYIPKDEPTQSPYFIWSGANSAGGYETRADAS